MKKFFLILSSLLLVVFSCGKNENGNRGHNNQGEGDGPITIDGSFEDWMNLDGAYIVKNAPNSMWDAVKELRVYASGDYVYYYIRFDREVISEYLDQNDKLPARVNLNTDGEFTSGYENYFLQAYDFIIELSLGNGAGGWGSADDSSLLQRIDGTWVDLLGENSGLTFGQGSGYEFELFVDRTIFNRAAVASTVPMPMGDTFQTSMRFYETVSDPHWAELANIPNSDEGYGNLLEVTFAE